MLGAQGYIVRVLRRVETALRDDECHTESATLGKIIHKLSRAENVVDGLELLYAVRGLDQFVLRLMWSLEHASTASNELNSDVLDNEVETLTSIYKAAMLNGRTPSRKEKEADKTASVGLLYDALHDFGRVVEDVRRGSFDGEQFRGIDEERLFRILQATGSLQRAAGVAGHDEVVRFSGACSGFVQYSLDHALVHDVRIINMLENANITLQTSLATGGEDLDSLQQTIELLQAPERLLSDQFS
jgi:hypothetical protein